jgi:hypothetical protein
MGSYGYRAAVVTFCDPLNGSVLLTFYRAGKEVGHGRRDPHQCFPRDSALNGADKPPKHGD